MMRSRKIGYKSAFILSIAAGAVAAVCLWAQKWPQPRSPSPQSAAPGSVQFAPAITLSAPGPFPASLAAGDFNNDGIPDLLLGDPNIDIREVYVALGNGDGTFGSFRAGPSETSPFYVTAGDMNRDGNLDAVTLDIKTNETGISFGNGTGEFSSAVALGLPNAYLPERVAVADLNGDGIPDLVGVACLSVGTGKMGWVYVFLGQGHGFQQLKLIPSGGEVPRSLAVADFNGDGIPDLAVANSLYPTKQCCSNVAIFLGKGDGTFTKGATLQAGNPLDLVAADFNGDGKMDIATVSEEAGAEVLLGNGDGTFMPAQVYKTGEFPNSIVTADFNGDGILDLAIADYVNSASGYVVVLLGNGDGTFQAPIRFKVGPNPLQLITADFNLDGKPDIATVNNNNSTLSILLNTTPWPGR